MFSGVSQQREVSELVDPRPYDGGRLSCDGMPLLPVVLECDWMGSDANLQRAIVEQMWVIGAEMQIC
jgi:hypothetical protein